MIQIIDSTTTSRPAEMTRHLKQSFSEQSLDETVSCMRRTASTSVTRCSSSASLPTPFSERQSPRNKRRIRRAPIVSFDIDSTQYRRVPRRDDLSAKDVSTIWYNKEEYAEIRETNLATVELMKEGHTDPERFGYCYRGLEYKIDSVKQKRHHNITRAIDSALKTQDRLKRGNKKLSTISRQVAQVYTARTLQCRVDAHRTGLWDAKTVQALWGTPCKGRSEDKPPRMPRRTWAKAG